jgi:N-methylhydantoinase B/oxoprolinase/acetone carboxylase alpha subunit
VGEELFTQAMANVGNQFIADFSGPMLEAMTAMAAPLEQVRVSLENEKSTDEAPAAAISAPEVTVGEEEEVAFDFAETKRNLRRNGNARAE